MKKKISLLFILITIISCTGIGVISNKKENVRGNILELNEIKNDILESEIDNYDYKKLEEIKVKVLNILDNETDYATIADCNFILGNIYIQNDNNSEAINCFNKAIDYFDNKSNVEIKMKTYFQLSRLYLNELQIIKSENIFNKLKELAIEENKKEEFIEYSLLMASDISNYENGKSKAVDILEYALKLSEEIDYKQIEDVYLNLGRAYWYEDRLVESINTKLKALNCARGKNIESKIATISIDIGVDYLNSGNYEEAVIYLSRVLSYKIEDENESPTIKSYALANLIESYIELDDYVSAEESINILEKNIENINIENDKQDFIMMSYINKADLQTELGNTLEAISILNQSRSIYEKKGNTNFSNFDLKLYEEYGDAYYKLGNFKNALEYYKKCEKLALERGLSYLEEIYNEKIYLDYKAMGDDENTILYLEKNMELKTELSKDKSREYSQYLINEFESEENLEKIYLLEKSRNKILGLFMVLGFGTIIITIFLYYIYNQNKEINRLNKLFKDLSVTDALTKVHNRRALDEFLLGNWALYKKTEMPISFMMIDLDFFKLYNDNYGHLKGDKALEQVSKVIKESCRKADFVARYGGEEFIIVMLNTDKNEAINLAERIKNNIYNANIIHEYSKVSNRVTVSIGITTAHIGTNKNYDEYIQRADNALYEAKSKGKNTYVHI